jgi:hypothetical protein
VAPSQRWLVGGLATVAMLTLCASALALREAPRDLVLEASAEPPPAVVVEPAQAPAEASSVDQPRESPTTPAASPAPLLPTPAADGALPSLERPETSEPAPAEPSRVARPEASEPAAPEADTTLCWRTRKRAEQARDVHDWAGVLRHTRDPSCWAEQREQRRRLRAKGYMELEHWSECVETSRDLRDAEGRKWHELCRRRKEQG